MYVQYLREMNEVISSFPERKRFLLATTLEGAQAFNQLAVAFDIDCCRTAPSPGSVQRLTGRPRPRLPIPRAKTGTLALHMGGAWVLTEAVGRRRWRRRLEVRKAVAAPSGPVSLPLERQAAQSRQVRAGEAQEPS